MFRLFLNCLTLGETVNGHKLQKNLKETMRTKLSVLSVTKMVNHTNYYALIMKVNETTRGQSFPVFFLCRTWRGLL